MSDITKLSPAAITILKDLCHLPDNGMLEVRKIQYQDISLEDFYAAMSELDNSEMVTFMKRPSPYKPPVNEQEVLRKTKFPFFLKIKRGFKEICKAMTD